MAGLDDFAPVSQPDAREAPGADERHELVDLVLDPGCRADHGERHGPPGDGDDLREPARLRR